MTEYSKYLLEDMLIVAHEIVASPSGGVTADLSKRDTAVLQALSSMAQVSQRHQAVVDTALQRAGLSLNLDAMADVLRKLKNLGCIGGLIPLADGALLLTVTAAGMSRVLISEIKDAGSKRSL